MNESSSRSRLLAALLVLMLIAAACSGSTTVTTSGDDGGDDDSAAPETEPEPDPTVASEPEPDPTVTSEPEPDPTATSEPDPTATPEPVMGEIVESFLGSVLTPYGTEDITVGEVKAYWYNGSNGTRIVLYHGTGMTDLLLLCPGNSISTSAGFEFISNTPADPGACDGFPTEVSVLRFCTSGIVLYQTTIPNDVEGTFFASLEWNLADGSGLTGLTSQAPSRPDLPEINMDADAYAISPMFTSDGSDKISCGPMTSDGVNA